MSFDFSGLFLEHLFLLFMRILAILSSAPIFGQRNIPTLTRIGLAGLLAYLLLQVSPGPLTPLPGSLGHFLLLTVHEVILGLLVGFVATLALAGLTMAGTLVGNAIGLNAAQLLNPLTGEQATVMDQFYTMLAGLVFLSLGGHHWLILAMAQTMRFAPVGTFQVDPRILADLMPLSANVFVTAMRVALPVFGTVILTDMALATIARAVPQMNIFIVGLPLKAFVALAMLIVTLPLMESMITRIIREGMGHLANLLAVP